MKRNLGTYDRSLRVIGGMCLLILFAVSEQASALTWLFLALSGVLLVTGLLGYCPLYRVLHLNTRIQRHKTPIQ